MSEETNEKNNGSAEESLDRPGKKQAGDGPGIDAAETPETTVKPAGTEGPAAASVPEGATGSGHEAPGVTKVEPKAAAPEKKPNAPADKPSTAQTATPVTKPNEEPKVPDPVPAGEFGAMLEKAGFAVEHLGPDAMGTEAIRLTSANLLDACRHLRDAGQLDLLLSCTGIDWKPRLESVYHLYSTKTHRYLAVKVDAIDEHSPSLCPVWPAANWHERETYDLLGIQYDGHPNLQRILMPSDWLGHPLRKDYTVTDPRLVWNER